MTDFSPRVPGAARQSFGSVRWARAELRCELRTDDSDIPSSETRTRCCRRRTSARCCNRRSAPASNLFRIRSIRKIWEWVWAENGKDNSSRSLGGWMRTGPIGFRFRPSEWPTRPGNTFPSSWTTFGLGPRHERRDRDATRDSGRRNRSGCRCWWGCRPV